ncbi:PREDICTED: small RNA 2'-O-methyltransferase-like [Camelina sativa]|uniref:Small RNA 2'-O-methyltransferase n=1 Tax=Camelina sativa TaxID=90675 RepID=A0ABM0USF7_CAMSA|nr:PREDICTED: small RNA 2'-O-methyltransferase-like [Camelina sativa]
MMNKFMERKVKNLTGTLKFTSAVKLNSDATCINVLPFRDFEGSSKYFVICDSRGRVYVFLRNGDVLIEFFTTVDFPVTAMVLSGKLTVLTENRTVYGSSVDISQKGLARAAKMLRLKLNKGPCNLKSTTLYDGSILEFDSRLQDIDVGTCLEVIEHMEEDQACQFGKTVLTLFRPKLLIISTPNYECNKILHKRAPDNSEKKSISQPLQFRNHDHKFEWTRKQFNQWATKLAKGYHYSVEFSGVGGSGIIDPGFASQIAIFRRKSLSAVKRKDSEGSMQPYKVTWEWTRRNGDKKD